MSEFNFVVPPSVAKAVGLEEGIVLYRVASLVEFTSRNAERVKTNFIGGKWWYRASYKSWVDIFSGIFNQRKILRIFEGLVKGGYLEKGVFNNQFSDRTAWYALTEKTRLLLDRKSTKESDDHVAKNGHMEDTKSGKLMLPKMETCHVTKNGNINNIYNNIYNKVNTPLTPQGEDVLLSLEQDVPAVDADNGFDAFWTTYPKCDRKIGRSKCLEIWRKNELHLVKDKVMKALQLDMKTNSWTKDNGAWVPMPQTWLNRKRHVDMDYTSATASSTAKAKWAVYTYDDVRQHSEEWDMWQKNKHTGAKAPAWSIKDADWVKENRDIIISAEKLNG